MDTRIKDIFNDVCKNLKIDVQLCQKIKKTVSSFVLRNEDHAKFFGGNLIGPYTVKMTTQDQQDWFENILGITEDDVTDRCANIIDPVTYKVAGNPFNLSCVWLAYRVNNAPNLSTNLRSETLINIFNYLQIKFLTSRMFRHWPHGCSIEVAEATLAQMTNKYDIKVQGTWLKLLSEKSRIISTKSTSIHWEVLDKMNIDTYKVGGKSEGVAYLLVDVSTRIKNMLLGIYGLQKSIQESKEFEVLTSSGISLSTDGTAMLKDKEASLEKYRNYLESVVSDPKSFIKPELVSLVLSQMKNIPQQIFVDTLTTFSKDHVISKPDTYKMTNDIIETCITHCLLFLSNNRQLLNNRKDVLNILIRLKGIYISGKGRDEVLLSLREYLDIYFKRSLKIKSNQLVQGLKTSLSLYLVLRALTLNSYG